MASRLPSLFSSSVVSRAAFAARHQANSGMLQQNFQLPIRGEHEVIPPRPGDNMPIP